MTRIVATADFHGFLPEQIPACDLLLIAGDICPVQNHDRKFQAEWLRGEFCDWLNELPAYTQVVAVGGNHDFVLQDSRKFKNQLPWHLLYDEVFVTKDGLKIWGSPMSPTFGNWAFMRDDRGLGELWETIPKDIDILMVHGPMHGHGDLVPHYSYQMMVDDKGKNFFTPKQIVGGERVGSVSLFNRLRYEHFPNLKLFVFGHIHEGYGQEVAILGDNQFIAANVSHVNAQYKAVNPPMKFEL